jgi:flagellar biosynthesis component FlhA
VYGGHSKVQRLFRGFEETFFAEFGFLLPDLVWMPSTTMPEGTISLGIDAWSSLPAPIIVRGERVVDSLPEHLPVPGRPAVHPVTGARCAIVADAKKEELEKAGFDTWGPIDFVLLNVFSEVMPRAGRLLGIEDVEYQLARLNFQLIRSDTGPRTEAPSELVVAGQAPTLVDETLTRYSLGELTRVLRFLVSERLSMQNLGGILDRLLQYDTVPVESDTLVVLDSRLALRDGISEEGSEGHYEFLRKQLRSFLSYRFAWQENTVVAYLLDPDLEHDIAADLQARRGNGGTKLSESRIESFRDAVWDAVTALGPAPLGQVILTTPAARTGVREFLAPELPELPVLAYSELRPDVNVQPIARIAAD